MTSVRSSLLKQLMLNQHKQLHMIYDKDSYSYPVISNSPLRDKEMDYDLKKYQSIGKEEPHKCDMCGEQFVNAIIIQQHVMSISI